MWEAESVDERSGGGPVPEAGTATGDDGGAGELVDGTPLRAEEEAVLAELERLDGSAPAVVGGSPEVERAP